MSGARQLWIAPPKQIIGQIDPDASTLNQILNMTGSAIIPLPVGERSYRARFMCAPQLHEVPLDHAAECRPRTMHSPEESTYSGGVSQRFHGVVGWGHRIFEHDRILIVASQAEGAGGSAT